METYDWFTSTGHDGALSINSDGTFGTSFKETGQWTSLKTSVALRVTDSGRGDLGCVFLGTFSTKGIDSAKKQGVANCNGQAVTWYATKDTTAKATESARSLTYQRLKPVHAGTKVVGRYTLFFLGTSDLNIQINGDTTANVYNAGFSNDGYWVAKAKVVAVNMTYGGGDRCLWLGTLNKSGLNSEAKPGSSICDDGSLGSWYATKQAS